MRILHSPRHSRKLLMEQLERRQLMAADFQLLKYADLAEDLAVESMTAVGSTVFFNGGSKESGQELWKTDGTAAGTTLVKDIYPGEQGSSPTQLIEMGGSLYFTAITPGGGRALFRSDGTNAGTITLKDAHNAADKVLYLTAVGSSLYFTDGSNTIWKSDGTREGTVPLATSGGAYHFTAVGETVFFTSASRR